MGPEMGSDDLKPAKRGLRSRLSVNKLKRPISDDPPEENRPAHRTWSAFIASNYGSVKTSVKRVASVKVTKWERHTTRAQDIFATDSNNLQCRSNTPASTNLLIGERSPKVARGRSATPMSALSLDKPLPALPDDEVEVIGNISSHEFERYLDILAYSQRDLPSGPGNKLEQKLRKRAISPVQDAIIPAPKEDEWMSTRPRSQMSSAPTTSAYSEEARRLRSRPPSGLSGLLTRSTSVSGRTVTPMSSLESERELRGVKRGLPGTGVAPRIEEVSEPGTTSPSLTPKCQSISAPNVCYHCGRDPSGKDVKRKSGSTTTVLDIFKYVSQDEEAPEKTMSPAIVAQDDQGQKYALCRETSRFRILEGTEGSKENSPKTPEKGTVCNSSSPLIRPSNPDPYATNVSSPEMLADHRERAEYEFGDEEDASGDPDNTPQSTEIDTPCYERLANSDRHAAHDPSSGLPHDESESQNRPDLGTEIPHNTSFWKNPDGVIVVYQGIEIGGEELYFGSDINYLGSFKDDDEGSSGLGSIQNSTNDLFAAGSDLAMIPEVGSSDEMWEDEVL
ncbi:unnamed protein product [Discula destructiva]